MKTKRKRVVFVADMHCGSAVALSPYPDSKTQRMLLDLYKQTIAEFGERPDVLICGGDAIDGQDLKGLSTKDPRVNRQVGDAMELLMMWKPKSVFIVEGTGYHTGSTTAFEQFLSDRINDSGTPCTFHTKLRLRLNGWMKVQVRHQIGNSSVPYGAHTAPARSLTNQVLNAAVEAREKGAPVDWPHLLVFGHCHKYSLTDDDQGTTLRLPCWKATGDRHGELMCDGHISLGAFQIFVGTKKEGWTWQKKSHYARLESRTVEA
jgi:hypothetical protein